MTLRYSHLSPDHKKRAVDVLNSRIDTFSTLDVKSVTALDTATSQFIENIEVIDNRAISSSGRAGHS